MSNLQIGLAIAGALVIAAVMAHGAWVSRRSQPRQAEPESRFGVAYAQDEAGSASDGEPVLLPLPVMEKKPTLDPLIDVIAPISLDAPIAGEAVLAVMPGTRRVGSKPFAIEGLNVARQQWEMPVPGQSYDSLLAGVQLANRSGALNEIEFSEFVVKTQAFADAVNGAPEFPDMLHEVARARELDSFASTHDAQLSVSLRARTAAWSPGYVQQNAARVGFVSSGIPGRMLLPASHPGATPLLVLSFDPQAALAEDPAQTAIRELNLSLDVAQVERAEQPFVLLREVIRHLAQTMEGLIIDDDGQPLTEGAMDQIAFELENLYDNLDARELSAGSALARRLFS